MSLPTKVIQFTLGKPAAPPQTVTFRRSFMLPGLDRPHRPGTFALRETRTQLDVSWSAHVLSLSLILVDGAFTQVLDVSRRDLDDALERDAAPGSGP
jgi:hypothetical protein